MKASGTGRECVEFVGTCTIGRADVKNPYDSWYNPDNTLTTVASPARHMNRLGAMFRASTSQGIYTHTHTRARAHTHTHLEHVIQSAAGYSA